MGNRLERIKELDSFISDPNVIMTEDMAKAYKELKRHCVKVDGEWYSVRYFHRVNNVVGLPQMLEKALEAGQIKEKEYSGGNPTKFIPTPKRGYTICTLEADGRRVVATGYAFCSYNDVFNRKVGRQIAFGRAVSQLKKNNEQLRLSDTFGG